MDGKELVRRTAHGAVVDIGRDELTAILEAFETTRAVDTRVAGWIRVFSIEGTRIVQEETPDRKILVRSFESAEAADAFVDRRLSDYDRMWDGCGCKIDYFGPAPAG